MISANTNQKTFQIVRHRLRLDVLFFFISVLLLYVLLTAVSFKERELCELRELGPVYRIYVTFVFVNFFVVVFAISNISHIFRKE